MTPRTTKFYVLDFGDWLGFRRGWHVTTPRPPYAIHQELATVATHYANPAMPLSQSVRVTLAQAIGDQQSIRFYVVRNMGFFLLTVYVVQGYATRKEGKTTFSGTIQADEAFYLIFMMVSIIAFSLIVLLLSGMIDALAFLSRDAYLGYGLLILGMVVAMGWFLVRDLLLAQAIIHHLTTTE